VNTTGNRATVSEQPQELTGQTDVPSNTAPVLSPLSKAPDSESPRAEPAGPPTPQGSAASSAASVATSADDGMSREVRLGLVLYGGVSLAIYMNGVANEFFNAVRGRGIYALIKALTDSDVIVDIVSGASAGGINGVFLAYALCNEKEFGDFAQLWRNQGDVDLLLRKPDGAPETYLSLFDSEHYYQQSLQDAFRVVRDIDQTNVFETPSGILDGIGAEERPHVKELDLYIAGTNVGGNIFTQIDDAGHAITVKDHRSVFLLSHRRGRKTPFAPKNHPDVTFESLAKLSRITSAFPAAFSPVKVEGVKPDKVTVDGRLQRWGQIGVKAYFIDGGVLYNKPFGYTIKGIEFRLANTETERFLLYVEPDPERFDEELKKQQAGLAEAPNFFTDISDSLISLPGYQSIAGDLQDLADQNSKVQRYLILTKTLQERVWKNPEAERKRYVGAGVAPQDPSSELQDIREPAQELHHRSRLLGLGERVIQGALRNEAGRKMFLKPVQAQAAERLTCWLFERLRSEEDQKAVLENTDVFYRLRRLFYTTGVIRALLYKQAMRERRVSPDSEHGKTYLKLRHILNRQIELLQIVQTVMEEMVDRYRIVKWDKISRADQMGENEASKAWALVSNLLQLLLNTQGTLPIVVDDYGKYQQFLIDYGKACETDWPHRSLEEMEKEWLPQSTLAVALNGLRSIRDFLQNKEPDEVTELMHSPERQPFQGLLSVIDRCTQNAFLTLTTARDDVRVAYDNFDLLDSVLYPSSLPETCIARTSSRRFVSALTTPNEVSAARTSARKSPALGSITSLPFSNDPGVRTTSCGDAWTAFASLPSAC
jgi:patatin-related protein